MFFVFIQNDVGLISTMMPKIYFVIYKLLLSSGFSLQHWAYYYIFFIFVIIIVFEVNETVLTAVF